MEVLGAVAPPANVDAPDSFDAPHRSLHLDKHHSQLGGERLGQVARVAKVITRFKEDD